MRIHIATLSEVGSLLEFQEKVPVSKFPLLMEHEYAGDKATHVQVQGTVIKTEAGCLVTGKIKVPLVLACTRCLTNFTYKLVTDFTEEFVNKSEVEVGSFEFDSLSVDLPTYHGDTLDLRELISESILLAIPMKIVCNAECKGICPECGQLLNEKTCKCNQRNLDPRLAVLADLFENE